MPDDIDALLGIAPQAEPDTAPAGDGKSEYFADGTRRQVDGLDRRPRTKREPAKRRHRRILREQACASQIGELPEPGEDVVMILTGDWHGWDVLGAVLDLAGGATIERLHIATLGFNRTQGQHLADLIDDGQIGRVTMVVSEIFSEKSIGEFGTLHRLLVEERSQSLASTRNHAKLICCQMTDDRRFAIHGSLNLRRCNAFEQMIISHDRELYQFFVDYIEEVATSGKAASSG